MPTSLLRAAVCIIVAGAFLNVAVTFHNVWPTPLIRPVAEWSIECAVIILVLAWYAEWTKGISPWLRWLATIIFLILVLGRYADVTAPALFGRPINMYWDATHLPKVAAMLAAVAPTWVVADAVIGLVILVGTLTLALYWAVRGLAYGLTQTPVRRVTAAVAALIVAAFLTINPVSNWLDSEWPRKMFRFSLSVTAMYAQQVRFIIDAWAADAALPVAKTSAKASDLGRLAGADVYVFFFESYGATVFDEPASVEALQPHYAAIVDLLAASDWRAASALVESTTFGGSSWLAHASFMTGLPVRGQQHYQMLLTTQHPTLVDDFRAAGYRTVALMPGLRKDWPEGAFYGFDKIYTMKELDYGGPAFGWWAIPDQYSLEALHQREFAVPRRPPLFTFFPTIMSHAPFGPTPPYQPDWSRLMSPQPYDDNMIAEALDNQPEWTHLRPAYLRTIGYNLDYLRGYLRERAAKNALIIALGDHQPPAAVSGEGAPWSVPVHIITQDVGLFKTFIDAGFEAGMRPSRPVVGEVDELYALLLDVFDSGKGAATTFR